MEIHHLLLLLSIAQLRHLDVSSQVPASPAFLAAPLRIVAFCFAQRDGQRSKEKDVVGQEEQEQYKLRIWLEKILPTARPSYIGEPGKTWPLLGS